MKRTSIMLAVTALGLTGCGGAATADDAAVRAASCSDATGDGGPADIVSVDLVEDGGDLSVTYRLAQPLDTSADTLLSLIAWSEDGATGRQLGAKWVGGTPTVFAFDLAEAQNQDVDVEPAVEGDTVSVTYPASAVEGLGESWGWTATTSVDGVDVDDCPEPGDDVLNPQRQPFPS